MKKEMKTYETPELRVYYVNDKDIIATSPTSPDEEDEEDDDNTTGTVPGMPWG